MSNKENKITKKRCVSGCKFLSRDVCSRSTRCKFIDGSTRKYCRLTNGFKMRKSDCKVTKRIKKNEARKKIREFILNKGRQTRNIRNIEKMTKKNNAKKIFKFIKKVGEKRTTEHLKSICSDSGVCIAFGNNREKINKFFDGFTDFDYVEPPIKRLGKPSNNGFVREIKYKKNDYVAYSVLKSSARSDSDNLVYEYIVGEFINQQCKFYPCFLETYGFYFYKDREKWTHMKKTKLITSNVLKDSLDLQTNVDYAKMCKQSKYAAILIQHLKDANAIDDMVNNSSPDSNSFITEQLLYVLYQIYMPLAQLRNNFTQYDLHGGNVLVYEPIKGKHITYHYHVGSGQTVIFNSQYIAKIIDYGRSFFKYKGQTGKDNSPDVYKKLCDEPKCISYGENCGVSQGFGWFSGPLSNENYFISSQVPNISHDLRLLYNITDAVKENNLTHIPIVKELEDLLDSVQFGKGIRGDEKRFGTNVNKKLGFPNTINNVVDAERALREIIMNNENAISYNESKYKIEDKIGDIHVYVDGSPMRFEPV
jgi:hypothetical protein